MHHLSITRQFNMSVDALFAAWSSAEAVARWFAPGSMTVPEAEVDFVVGGRYRVVMEDDDGSRYIVGGTYHSIVPGERISFSWQWEHGEEETEVMVRFKPLGEDRSELILDHTDFADPDNCNKHESGWNGCLDNLVPALA